MTLVEMGEVGVIGHGGGSVDLKKMKKRWWWQGQLQFRFGSNGSEGSVALWRPRGRKVMAVFREIVS